MDLVRDMLIRLDELHIPAGSSLVLMFDKPPLKHDSESMDDIAYTVELLEQAAFLNLTPTQPAMGICLRGLTWNGHDFLDSVRDPEIWRKTKEAATKAGGFTMDLLVGLAKGFIKTQIEKHTGVKI